MTKFTAFALIILQSLLYGFGDPISKEAYETVPVLPLLSIRYWLAFIFLMLCFGRSIINELRHCHLKLLVAPSVCIACSYVSGNIALGLTEVTTVAFLRSLSTIFTPLIALLIYKKHYDFRHIPILVAVVIGTALMCGFGGLSGFGLGELCAIFAAVLVACSLLTASETITQITPLTLTAVQSLSSALVATLCTFATETAFNPAIISTKVWLIILYLAILCTVAGYLLQNLALRKIEATTISLLQCACPIMTAFFSYFLLGEMLNTAGMLGAALILMGIAAETKIKN